MDNKQHLHNMLENISDILWLSHYMESEPVAKEADNHSPDTATSKQDKPPENPKQTRPDTPSPQHNEVEFYTDQQAEDNENALGKPKRSATAVHSPKKLALSNYRAWEKAFKFINLKTASKNKIELDEAKTVENIAASNIFDLTFRHQQERHFFLTLVIDRGDTMGLWVGCSLCRAISVN